ncbi:hypothetical protein B0H19DRAFT_1297934 [Mycena capillaripes]|nr:hypothetical protein B0H19DRAFT_1297934 [Mycena capillaripes]
MQILRPRFLMVSRSLYLYQPLGGKPSSWRDLLNPVRCTAILLVVALSLTSIGFLLIQRPWGSVVAPNMFIPAHELEDDTTVPDSTVYPPFKMPSLENTPVPEPIDATVYPPFETPSVENTPVPEFIDDIVYHPFQAPSAENILADQAVRPIKAHAPLSDECLDQWVSTGLWQDPCRYNMVQDAHIDLVYVWVNGSDPLHQKARKALLSATKYRTKEARFREHDELRYSLRSARNATASWPNNTWHIITADVPSEPRTNNSTTNSSAMNDSALDHTHRLGLVPQWLDIECSFYGCLDGQPPIRIQHDTQLFRLTGRPGAALSAEDATTWLGKILPSFNSHAVESQLPHLEIVSDNIVALNDDQFILLPLPPSAFHTTLYGQVFRMDPGLMVGGDSSGSADGGDQRFGTRKRPYMQHNARALSVPLMHEVSLAFGEYFAATPLSQFRGSHKVPMEYEVNTIFLSTHYVVERHREALLWSWVVGKWGGSSGIIDREQKLQMWQELGGGEGDTLRLGEAERTTADDVEVNLLMAGVQPPGAVDKRKQGDTTYSWVSMDGYSADFHALAKKTQIKRGECIGEDVELAWNMFGRLLKTQTACGDDVIAALMHNSQSGLEVFLPAPSSSGSAASDPMILPFVLPWQAPPLPANPRAFAVRLLMRYAYVLGDSPTIFMGMKDKTQAARLLKNADSERETALLCINDDLGDGDQKAANTLLKNWFERRWPEKLGCEL